jgi:nucleotide-binding universal stress UspA family protein
MNSQQHQAAAGRIVVGVDGSAPANSALAWAVRQAGLTGSAVEAVIAWHYPVAAGGYGFAPVAALEDTDFPAIYSRVLSDALTATVDPASPVKITTMLREGNAAQILLEVAADAALLVVGSRGHGGFAGALLGSVSQHCAQHAPCPLVIVRDAGQH